MSGFQFLESLLMFGIKPGLESTQKLCDALGNPEKTFRTVHVVGTNGKGSTSFYLSNILIAHGAKIVLYTSPHLVSLQERIRLNGTPIARDDFDKALLAVKSAAEKTGVQATYFEALTVAAFVYAREQGVEFFVAEAGLGGRFDATAVANGELAILTGIGLEHTAVLGDTEEKILFEKLSIVKQGGKLVRCKLSAELERAAANIAKERGFTELARLDSALSKLPKLPNAGRHYEENAILALTAAQAMLGEAFNASKASQGLQTSFWPGRMQKLYKNGKLKFILDGAHNPHAAKRLAETLREEYPGKKFHAIFGALQDKDLSEMLSLMASSIGTWHPVRTPYERFRDTEDLAKDIQSKGYSTGCGGFITRDAISAVEKEAGDEPVLITGSLYLIGACIYLLKDEFEELAFFRGMEPEANEKH